jgi:hypothetical protein
LDVVLSGNRGKPLYIGRWLVRGRKCQFRGRLSGRRDELIKTSGRVQN